MTHCDAIPVIRVIVNAIASHLLIPGTRYRTLRLDLQDGGEMIDLGPFEVDENGQVVSWSDDDEWDEEDDSP